MAFEPCDSKPGKKKYIVGFLASNPSQHSGSKDKSKYTKQICTRNKKKRT
jgi:hypothetical protein